MINKILNANNSNLLLHNGLIVFDMMRTKTFEEVATDSATPLFGCHKNANYGIKMHIGT